MTKERHIQRASFAAFAVLTMAFAAVSVAAETEPESAESELSAVSVTDSPPGFAWASIGAEGDMPDVLIPVGGEARFDLVVELPYVNSDDLGSDPSALLVAEDVQQTQWTGDVVIEDDPTSAEVQGPVRLFFGGVANGASAYRLTLSWEPDNVYLLDPTDTVPFDVVPIALTVPDVSDPTDVLVAPAGGRGGSYGSSSGGKSNCRTYVNAGYGISDAEASGSTTGGNIWKTYAELNYNVDIMWYGKCKAAGPGTYGTGTGYAAAVRGPNNLAMSGLYLIEIGVAHMGGGYGFGSSDGFGFKSVGNMPSLTLHKPSGGKVKLEDGYVKGLNKKSCTNWPGELKTALSLIPVNYWWSVMVTFSPETACVANWQPLNSGTPTDLSRAGFQVTKSSVTNQYEHGGRIEVRAVNTGDFRMPFTYTQHIYGKVRAHGNPDASFSVVAPVTTSVAPMAKVV